MKNKPMRTCVYTRTKEYKSNLIRLVKDENEEYILDRTQKMQKRGIYIYPCDKSLVLLEKNKKYKIKESEFLKIKEEILRKK